MKTTRPPDTYESVALGALAYEFSFSKRAEAEDKITKRFMPFAVFCYYLK